jgi:hypothetical protein
MRSEIRNRLIPAAALLLLLGLSGLAAPVDAQPMGAPPAGAMPNLRTMSGKPLPDPGLAAGTVTVRVARKLPANAVAGVEVSAIIKNPAGDAKKRTATTDAEGRATFEAVTAGHQFTATVTVDGERLSTTDFTMPPSGGIRTMLIAGLGPPGAGDDQGGAGAGERFSLGAMTGQATPVDSLPTGTIEVMAYDESGKPLPNQAIMLGAVATGGAVKVHRGITGADGAARFDNLATGQGHGYAAVTDWKGLRIGTEPFGLPDKGGVRAEIRALQRTADPSVITIGTGGRVVITMRDDSLLVQEMLPLENRSSQLFDPGPGGVEIPLPTGFVSAQGGEGDHKIEIRKNHGVAVHGPISPKATLGETDARAAGDEVMFGFILPYTGSSKDFEQPMPTGMGRFTLITEQIPGISIEGAGIGAREPRELNGKKYWVMPGDAVPAGGSLKFTINGLPSLDRSGRAVAGTLALMLAAAAVVFGRRPAGKKGKPVVDERQRLTALREKLFTELVTLERKRPNLDDELKEKRKQLFNRLEKIYQDLAALDEQRAA